jgi:hypothetical protein
VKEVIAAISVCLLLGSLSPAIAAGADAELHVSGRPHIRDPGQQRRDGRETQHRSGTQHQSGTHDQREHHRDCYLVHDLRTETTYCNGGAGLWP